MFHIEIILEPLKNSNSTKGYKVTIQSFFLSFFLQLHLQHMEVPRLGVELELQLPAFATATAIPDPQPTE